MANNTDSKIQIDKTNFVVGAIAVIIPTLFVLISDMIEPGSGRAMLTFLKNILTHQLGGFYMWVTIIALIFCFAVAFSKYGKLKLGEPDEEPEYKTLPWIAMIFSAGIGAGVLWGGGSEWIYYMTSPPLDIQPGTKMAKEIAITYGMFHWGPSAWALYTVSSITIAYMYFVQKKPVLKVSSACNGVLGERANGPLGNAVDIIIMVGLVTASATSLGLGTPMVGAGVAKLFGIEQTAAINLIILAIVVCVFAVSSTRGLKEGMKKVSTFNIYIAIGLLGFVLIFGGYFLTTIESFTTSVGYLISNFVRMSTYMEPFSPDSSFVSDWTIFYWAWWVAYGPFMGLFFAKISRGRTMRSMVLNTILFGTLGCSFFFAIFGNFGMGLLNDGIYDAPARLVEEGYNSFPVIIEMFSYLPLGTIFIAILCISAILFMATTFDAASFALAAMTCKELPADKEPANWNKLFWALLLGLIPSMVILVGGDLGAIQTSTVVGGFFMCIIVITVGVSFLREVKSDAKNCQAHMDRQEEYEKSLLD